jgi:phosphatidylglycerol:prolipoprotein diacylglycerol transferase
MAVYWIFLIGTWLVIALRILAQRGAGSAPVLTRLDLALWPLPMLLLGSHATSCLMGLGEISDLRAFFFTLEGWRAGHVSFGALGGALVGVALAVWSHRLPIGATFDQLLPNLFVASVVMRLGCFATGCCFGAPTDLPWGVRFWIGHPLVEWTRPAHPVQLYESGASLLMLIALLPYLRRRGLANPPGAFALGCVALFCAERFVIEFFRVGGTTVAWWNGLSKPHLVMAAVLLGALFGLAGLRRRVNRS